MQILREEDSEGIAQQIVTLWSLQQCMSGL